MFRPRDGRVPKQSGGSEIEQGEKESDDECGEEEVPEENDLLAIHAAIIQLRYARSITKTLHG